MKKFSMLSFFALEKLCYHYEKILLGARLQDVWSYPDCIVFQIYQGGLYHLVFQYDKGRAQVVLLPGSFKIKEVKGSHPVTSYTRAHMKNMKLEQCLMPQSLERIVEFVWSGPEGLKGFFRFYLIPGYRNLEVRCHDKSLWLKKPRERETKPFEASGERVSEEELKGLASEEQAQSFWSLDQEIKRFLEFRNPSLKKEESGRIFGEIFSDEHSSEDPTKNLSKNPSENFSEGSSENSLESLSKNSLKNFSGGSSSENLNKTVQESLLKKRARILSLIEEDIEKKKKAVSDLEEFVLDWQQTGYREESYPKILNETYSQIKKIRQKIQASEKRMHEILEGDLVLEKKSFKSQQDLSQKLSQGSVKARIFQIEGFVVSYGKSGADNLKLLRLSQPWDLWFHVEKASAPHFVLKRRKNEVVPESVIIQTAQRVVTLSGKSSSDVVVTEVRFVQPIKGSVGLVQYRQERRIRL
jgi:predicted ribosome quality control (RQC) complex YloA/Tae2 family protein